MNTPIIILTAGLVVFAGLALSLIVVLDRQRRRHQARLLRLRPDIVQLDIKPRNRKPRHGSGHIFERVQRRIEQTNLRLSVAELFVQVSLGILSFYALSVLVLGLNPLIALPIAIAIPIMFAAFVLRIAKTRYMASFTADLPEALDVFARGMRAGRPISDSLSIVVDNTKGPIQRELSRCRDEISMGTNLPDSLHRLEARVPTTEVSFFSVATSLQAEVGGNLIETMESLATQLRERRKLRKKARALSSEARASAMILAALPFAVTLAISVLNASYIAPLYADPRGRVMALAALSSIALGVFIMIRMGKLDV